MGSHSARSSAATPRTSRPLPAPACSTPWLSCSASPSRTSRSPGLRLLAGGCRGRQLGVAAERTAQDRLPLLEVQLLPALGHLLLEVLIAEHDPLPDVDEHVVDGTVAQPR